MTAATLERVTVADFLSRCDQDNYELIDGELEERSMGAKAVWVAGKFYKHLDAFNDETGGGVVFPDGVSLEIFGGRDYLPRPDGVYISLARLGSKQPPDGTLTSPPELVIEVVSPSDNAYEVERKVRRYLQAGVDRVWVAYPDARSVHTYGPSGASQVLEPPMSIEDEAILPGFSRPVADFFPLPGD